MADLEQERLADDDALGERLRTAIASLPAPRRSRHLRPWIEVQPAGGTAPLPELARGTAMVTAAIIAAVVLGNLLVSYRTQRAASPEASPSSVLATPLPSGVIDPAPLVDRVLAMTAIVHRVDMLATRLTSAAEYLGPGASFGTGVNVPGRVWVVAVVGEVGSSSLNGRSATPSQCGLFAYDAETGAGWSSSIGALSMCQPYFARSLTPPDQPVSCAPAAYDNGVPRTSTFSPTTPGPVVFTPVRDDAWREPRLVSGSFLAQAPQGTVPYEDAFCLGAFVRQGPAIEKLLATGIGATAAAARADFAIWLRGYHALGGTADGAGHIDVVVERRAGYEWAYFDWHALVPGGGYVMFTFRDSAGSEVLPWRLANGP
jgi:hypothetical protein